MANLHKTFLSRSVFYLTFMFLASCLPVANVSAQASVAVNSLSKGGVFRGILDPALTQLNFNHTITEGPRRSLYVLVATYGQARTLAGRVSNVQYVTNEMPAQTFNLQLVGTALSPSVVGSLSTAEVYRLISPPVSSGQIRVTTIGTDYIFATATTLNNVNQITPNRGFFTDNGNYNRTNNTDAPLVTVSDAQTGDLVIDILGTTFEAGSAVEGPGQNVCTEMEGESSCTRGREFFGGVSDVGASSREFAMSPVTMSWTTLNGGDYALGAFAVAVAPPTAASVTLGGRILSATEKAVSGARVVLIEADGTTRYAVTNPFGYYRLSDVAAGQTVTVEVRSKRYEFQPQVINVTEEMKDLNFTAEN